MTKKNKNLRPYHLFIESLFWLEERSHYSQYILELISHLQFISIIFSVQSYVQQSTQEDPVSDLLRGFFEIISLFGTLTSKSKTTSSNIFVYVSWFYLILLIIFAAFIYWKYCESHKVHDNYHLFLSYWAQCHHTTVFWSIHAIILSRFAQFLFNDEGELQTQYVELIFDGVFGVLNLFFAIIAALYCYDPFLSKNPLSTHSSSFQAFTLLFKIIMGPVIAFIVNKELLKWIFLGLSGIIIGLRYELLFRMVPYYRYSVFVLLSCVSGCAFFIIITNLFTMIFAELQIIDKYNLHYVQIPFIAFSIKITLSRINRLISHYTSLPVDQLKTPYQIFIKSFALRYNINKAAITFSVGSKSSHNLAYIHLYNETLYHQTNCQNEGCSCTSFIQKNKGCQSSSQANLLNIENQTIEFLLDMQSHLLDLSVKKFPRNDHLRIHYAYTLLQQKNKLSKALFTIFDIDKSKTTFRQEVLLCLISKYIEEKSFAFINPLSKTESQLIDVKRVLECQEISNRLSISTKKYAFEYIQFWSCYQRPSILLAELLQKTIILEMQAQKIDTLWAGFVKINQYIPNEILPLYQSYMLLLRNAPYSASKPYSYTANGKFSNIGIPLAQTQTNKESSIVLYVSMSRENLGNIIQASYNIKQYLGWSQAEVTGKNIHHIMPSYLRDKHTQLLLNYLEKGNKSPSFQNESFVQTKEGHVIPVHVFISIYPYAQNEPIYVAIINRRMVEKEVLGIGGDGIINCFSKGMANRHGLNIASKTHISQICRDFHKLKLDLLDKRKSIFKIPRGKSLFYKGTELLSIPTEKEATLKEIDEVKEISLKFQHSSKISETIYVIEIQKTLILREKFYFLYLHQKKDYDKGNNTENSPCSPNRNSKRLNFPSLVKNFESASSVKNDERISGSRGLRKVNEELLSEMSCHSDDNLRPFTESNREKPLTYILTDILSQNIQNNRNNTQFDEICQSISKQTNGLKEHVNLKKLEQAIYLVPKDKHTKMLNWLIVAFSVVCLTFMLLHLLNANQRLNKTVNQVDAISFVQRRSIQVTDMHRNVKYITLVNRDLIKDTRHIALGVPSFRMMRKQNLKENIEILNSLNSVIRNNDIIDKSAIAVNDGNSNLTNRRVDGFELFTELSNAANVLLRANLQDITDSNPQVQFIFQNSLNDILLLTEKMVREISEESVDYLRLTRRDISIFLSITCGMSIILLIILALDIYNFIIKRNRIIDLFFKISPKQLSNHINTILILYQSFWDDNSSDFKKVKSETVALISNILKPQNKNLRRTGSNFLSYKGLNTKMKQGIIFTVVCVVIFSSVFPVLSSTYTPKENAFLLQFDQMTKVDDLFIALSLGWTIILDYTGGLNNTLVKNRPIVEVIFEVIKEAKQSPDFLSSLTFTKSPDSYTPLVEKLLLGDLCQIIQTPGVPTPICQRLGAGVLKTGMIGLLSFMVKSNEESTYLYNYSDKSLEASKQALNIDSLITSEQIGVYGLKAGDILRNTLKNQLKEGILRFKNQTIWIILSYMLIYLILGFILSTKTWRRIKEERNSWRKLIRHIPFSVILENKEFERFLLRDCENVISSRKDSV